MSRSAQGAVWGERRHAGALGAVQPGHEPGAAAHLPAGLSQDPPDGVNASPRPDNIMHWNAVIFGPEDTVWDGGEPAHCSAMQWGGAACIGSKQEQNVQPGAYEAPNATRTAGSSVGRVEGLRPGLFSLP